VRQEEEVTSSIDDQQMVIFGTSKAFYSCGKINDDISK